MFTLATLFIVIQVLVTVISMIDSLHYVKRQIVKFKNGEPIRTGALLGLAMGVIFRAFIIYLIWV